MLITPERKVPQRSDASQNDHKSKGYPAKTSAAAFTMQVGYRRLYPTFASGFLLDFLKSGSTALLSTVCDETQNMNETKSETFLYHFFSIPNHTDNLSVCYFTLGV